MQYFYAVDLVMRNITNFVSLDLGHCGAICDFWKHLHEINKIISLF
jgi:hypothetical protein